MKALVDADVLLYEIGFSSQRVENGVVDPSSWEFCQELFDKKIDLIQDEVGGTEKPLLFLTNTPKINKLLNKRRAYNDELPKNYQENFRIEAAKTKDYKAGRKTEKPYHFYNLLNYILGAYNFHVNETGLEADDAMCIAQYAQVKQGLYDTTICSRDKDVRQCPGLHYSWESGRQAAIGPIMVDDLGYLTKTTTYETNGNIKAHKVFGVGQKFFYYQLLVGDGVDNIAGVKRRGPVFAFDLLNKAKSIKECYDLVQPVFRSVYGDKWKENFRELADLVWMTREVDDKGERIKWTHP